MRTSLTGSTCFLFTSVVFLIFASMTWVGAQDRRAAINAIDAAITDVDAAIKAMGHDARERHRLDPDGRSTAALLAQFDADRNGRLDAGEVARVIAVTKLLVVQPDAHSQPR